MNLACLIFRHQFTKVIGTHEFALFGRNFEFDQCLRCKAPNRNWVKRSDAVSNGKLWAQTVTPPWSEVKP